jgi:putative tryptophan/tyrosine transport system substrate-binding protein
VLRHGNPCNAPSLPSRGCPESATVSALHSIEERHDAARVHHCSGQHGRPVAAGRTSTAATTPAIGFLNSQSPGPFSHMVAGFREGLAEGGFVEGQNVTVEYRWAEGRYDRLPALANDLVRRGLAALVATGGEPSALAAKAATATIPVVFSTGGDPVQGGLVESLGRPGGNVTGLTLLTYAIEGKRVGLVQELLPKTNSIAALINPDSPNADYQRRQVLEAASRAGLRVKVTFARTETEFEPAFEAILRERVDALIVCADPYFNNRRDQLVALAADHKMPAMYEFREIVLGGGLMSYGVNVVEIYRGVGRYTARILKGAKPAEMPVLQPTKFDFIINLKTAKALGLDVPTNLLAIATEVIE